MSRKRVVIVGAGLAGLSAAARLLEGERSSDLEVIVLEACPYVGGRVRVDHQWDDIAPVDMGAEFIHGQDTVQMKLAAENGWSTSLWKEAHLKYQPETAVYLNGQLIQLWDTRQPIMAEALDAWKKAEDLGLAMRATQPIKPSILSNSNEDLADKNWENAEDGTLREACMNMGVSEDVKAILEAVFVQPEGGRLDTFGMADFFQDWPYGVTNLRLNASHQVLLRHYLKSIYAGGGSILVSSPVKAVEAKQGSDDILIRYQSGQRSEDLEIQCDYAIVTVSLNVLRQNIISFKPSLPQPVSNAIKALPMYPLIKAYMRFTLRFWPSNLTSLACCSGLINQYWMHESLRITGCSSQESSSEECEESSSEECPFFSLADGSNGDGFVQMIRRSDLKSLRESQDPICEAESQSHVPLVCAFATARRAEEVENLDPVTFISQSLIQLDEVFGEHATMSQPASSCFVSALLCDWTEHPYVRGGYSAPAVEGVASRHCLSEPVYDGRVRFAGEGTHLQPSSVQAAIETGVRAAASIQDSLQSLSVSD